MADNYLEFSEVIANLTESEEAWLKEQIQTIHVLGDKEYPEDAMPAELADTKPAWFGARFLRDNKDYDPQWGDVGFRYEFCDDHSQGGRYVTDSWGRHLWLLAEEGGNPQHAAWLVRKFLKKFRPDQCWGLTYATTCSKPRVSQFGGGAVFVTAKTICWQDGGDFIERKWAAFKAKKKTARRRKDRT